MATKKVKDPLVEKYFHSVLEDRETIHWQGEIVARIGDNYLLQLFEWFMGQESNQTLVPAANMTYWRFYDSAQEMNHHYDNYRRRTDAKDAAAKAAVREAAQEAHEEEGAAVLAGETR
jgi:hypothetical protein